MRDAIVPRSTRSQCVIETQKQMLEAWLREHCPTYKRGSLRVCHTIEIRQAWIAEFVHDTDALRFERRYTDAFITTEQCVAA